MTEKPSLKRHRWEIFLRNLKRFVTAEQVGTKAKWLFGTLALFLIGINVLNVVGSYVGRDFMTAIENRNFDAFVRMALIYVGVFAASTLAAVTYSFTEQRLGLIWRFWATRETILNYANHRVYYRLKKKGEIGNPDQRIADDIRTYCTTTLSFMLILVNASLTVIAFSGVMWTISPILFVVSVLYAAVGTFMTITFGRPLVKLNYDQLDKEANLRGSLIYLRGNAESVAVSRREGHLIQLNLVYLGDLAMNFRRIIAVNRNVGFFTTGYNWLIQIIPALIIAPLFIDGKVEFGVITQSAIAFTQLLGAFSIIVNQFQSISSYTAVITRLAALAEASETARAEEEAAPVVFTHEEGQVVYSGLTLRSPRSGRVLLKDLSVTIPQGHRVLVRGRDETARSALFLSTVGLWDVAEGRIGRPSLEQILLVTELPYLPPGTLRELLMRPWPEETQPWKQHLTDIQVPEAQIMETLRTLNIDSMVKGFGGLDQRQHWENILPLDQQQIVVLARVLLSKP
ncbi:MAG: ABC transporter transmembrane domain-containing protein, partial [Desulfobacterota bacterium]|nr:ABC transporter transmembrane domain-containing protein [Thermodesulfobacteriota bacterium]